MSNRVDEGRLDGGPYAGALEYLPRQPVRSVCLNLKGAGWQRYLCAGAPSVYIWAGPCRHDHSEEE